MTDTSDSGFLDHDPADLDWQNADPELKKLLDQVELDVKGWLPQPGAKLYGTVTDIDTGTSDYGDYPLVTIQTPSGKLVGLHGFHTVLRKRLENKIASGGLKIGYRIAVMYKGQTGEASAGKEAPHMYTVAILPTDA